MGISARYLIVKKSRPIETDTPSRFLAAVAPGRYSNEDIPYFRGCAAAGLDGASAVIDAIKTHGEIEIYFE